MLSVRSFLRVIFRSTLMAVFFTPFSVALLGQTVPKVIKWTVGGVEREALVYIPDSAKLTATPIVFVFHGHGGFSMDKLLLGKRFWSGRTARRF